MKINLLCKSILPAGLAALLLFTVAAQAADPAGTWTWTTPGRNGGPERVSTLTLKVEGAALTGKISVPGRDGQALETPIADGKVEGESVIRPGPFL